jgi:hypothetical protein
MLDREVDQLGGAVEVISAVSSRRRRRAAHDAPPATPPMMMTFIGLPTHVPD